MSRLREFLLRLLAVFRGSCLDRELDEELREHCEMLVEEYRHEGMSEMEARRAARIRLGGVEQIKEMHRDQRKLRFLEALGQDARYALRQIQRTPGFALLTVLTIALVIGMNAGIFSILNALAFQPIAVRSGERLLSVYPTFQGRGRDVSGSINMFSYSEYKVYRDENHVFSGLAGYVPFISAAVGGEHSSDATGTLATCNYFDVLNQRPTLGRVFVDSDCAVAGGNAVVVLSNDFWRGQRGADSEIVGKTISLNHTNFTVIGVAAPSFAGTEVASSVFWAPITMQAALMPGSAFLNNADLSWISVLGNPKPAMTMDEVRADLDVITSRLDAEHPGTMKVWVREAALVNRPEERGVILTVGAVLLTAVSLVLLIGCANIANFLLARGASRRREIAVRLALGASRGRLVRQLLTESGLLALIGGVLGVIVSVITFEPLVRLVIAHLPPGLPPMALRLSLDVRVLAYSLAVTLVTAIVFGLAPALRSSREDLNTGLKATSGGELDHPRHAGAFGNVLVSGQVAVCMTLLIAAGLLLRGLYEAQRIDPGFDRKGLTAVTFQLEQQGYSKAQANALHQRMKEMLWSLPGVDGLAETRIVPLSNVHWGTLAQVPGTGAQQPISYNRVSPNFFAMMGIPIVRGRSFSVEDVMTGAQVVVVSEELARRFWPGTDPLGKSLSLLGELPQIVIGVAKDAQVDHLGESHPKFLYLPTDMKTEAASQFLIHSRLDDASTLREMREMISVLDPNLSFSAGRLEDNLDAFRSLSRIVVVVSGALGGLALLLTLIGVYGLVSYAVSRRIREIGIRMALGANGQDVLGMILRQALLPVALGAVVGIAGCAAVSRILSSFLFGVSPLDPVTFAVLPVILLGIAALAGYVPGRRAARVDPMVALRYE
jgi:predicted permease